MAVRIGSLFVSLGVDTGPYASGMSRAGSLTRAATGGIRRDVGLTQKSVASLGIAIGSRPNMGGFIAASKQFDTLNARASLLRTTLLAGTAALGGFAAALSTNLLARYADTFTSLQNQIRVVSKDSADLAAQTYAVAKAATAARAGLAETAQLYSRLRKAAPTVAAEDILRYTQTIQKALQLGGATAAEASSAATQFSQAIASNRLSGDELRAVLETPLGLGLAKGLGVTIGQLRKMGTEGKLTSAVMLDALGKIGPEIDKQFAKANITIDQSLTIFDNMATMAVGNLNQTYGATKLVSAGIIGIANNLDTLIPLLIEAGGLMVSAFAGRVLSSPFRGATGFLKTELASRKQLLEDAKKVQTALGDELVSAGRVRGDLRNAARGDTTQFASGAAQKQLARDREALAKLDEKHIGLLDKRRQAYQDLSSIEASTSVKAIRLAEAQVAAEQRLNNAIAQRPVLRDNVVTRKATAAELGTTFLTKEDRSALAQAERDVLSAQNAIAKNEASIDKDRERISQLQIQRAQQLTAAENAASQQRIAQLRSIDDVEKQLSASSIDRELTQQVVRQTRYEAEAEGAKNVAAAVRNADQAVGGLQGSYAKAALRSAELTRGATLGAVALTGLARAGTSLVAFLGGPWGIAFAGAIAALAIFSAQSAKAAQAQADAERIIQETLKKRTETPGGGPAADSAAVSLARGKIEEIKKEIDILNEAMKGLNQTSSESVFVSGSRRFFNTNEWAKKVRDQVDEATAAFRAGTISQEEYIRRMDEISSKANSLEEAVLVWKQNELAIRDNVEAAKELNKEIADIERDIKIHIGFGDFKTESREAREALNAFVTNKAAFATVSKEEIARASGDKEQKVIDRANQLAKANKEVNATQAEWVALARDVIAAEDKASAAKKTDTAATKQYASFLEKLNRLQQEGRVALLGNIDQAVVNEANDLKASAALVKQYTDAILSGDLSKVPPELAKIREALIQKGAGEELDHIVQAYGTAAQLAGKLADEQARLNYLVANHAISADQAKIAYADFLGQFQNYQWINQASDAVTNFASSAITDFKNIKDAFKNLVMQLTQIILDELIFNPFKNWLRGMLAQAFGPAVTPTPSVPGPISLSPVAVPAALLSVAAPTSLTSLAAPAPLSAGVGAAYLPGFNTISTHEDAMRYGDPYNTVFGHGQFGGKGANLEGMTFDQVAAMSAQIKATAGSAAGPMGAYQIIESTLRAGQKALGFKGSDLYTKNAQDQLAQWRMGLTGGNPDAIRKAWTSLVGMSDADLKKIYSQVMGTDLSKVAQLNMPSQAIPSTMPSTKLLPSFEQPARQIGSEIAPQVLTSPQVVRPVVTPPNQAIPGPMPSTSILPNFGMPNQAIPSTMPTTQILPNFEQAAQQVDRSMVSVAGDLQNVAQAASTASTGFASSFGPALQNVVTSVPGGGGFLSSIFGGGVDPLATVDWNSYQLHSGGMVGARGAVARRVDPGLFSMARYAHRGLRPDKLGPGEMPLIGLSGERMFSVPDNRKLIEGINGARIAAELAAGGGSRSKGGTKVEVIDQRHNNAPPIQSESTRTANGEDLVRLVVRDEVGNMAKSGKYKSVGLSVGGRKT